MRISFSEARWSGAFSMETVDVHDADSGKRLGFLCWQAAVGPPGEFVANRDCSRIETAAVQRAARGGSVGYGKNGIVEVGDAWEGLPQRGPGYMDAVGALLNR